MFPIPRMDEYWDAFKDGLGVRGGLVHAQKREGPRFMERIRRVVRRLERKRASAKRGAR